MRHSKGPRLRLGLIFFITVTVFILLFLARTCFVAPVESSAFHERSFDVIEPEIEKAQIEIPVEETIVEEESEVPEPPVVEPEPEPEVAPPSPEAVIPIEEVQTETPSETIEIIPVEETLEVITVEEPVPAPVREIIPFTEIQKAVVVPETPYIFEPYSMKMSDWLWEPEEVTPPETFDDSFWDSFILYDDEAEVAVSYEPGLYYFTLYIDTDICGDIEVYYDGDDTYLISRDNLVMYLGNYFKPESLIKYSSYPQEYISTEALLEMGLETVIDTTDFTIDMTLPLDELAERVIKIVPERERITRNNSIAIDGAEVLTRSPFGVVTSIGYDGRFGFDFRRDNYFSMRHGLSISHSLNIFDVNFNLAYQMDFNPFMFSFRYWNGFFDLPEHNLRVNFGNIGSTEGRINGIPVGFSISELRHQTVAHQKEIKVEVRTKSIVKIYNNEKLIYEKVHTPGTYYLENFAFEPGQNSVRIIIEDINDPESYDVLYFDIAYDASLLSRGEDTFSFSWNFPRYTSDVRPEDATLTIPWTRNRFVSWYLDDFTMDYTQAIGLTDTTTLRTGWTMSPVRFRASADILFATPIGPVNPSMEFMMNKGELPTGSIKIDWRKSGMTHGTLSSTLGFRFPTGRKGLVDRRGSELYFDIRYSGNIGKSIGYSLNTNLQKQFEGGDFTYNAGLSASFNLMESLSIFASMNFSGINSRIIPEFRVAVNFDIDEKFFSSVSTDIVEGMNGSIRWTPNSSNSFNVGFNGLTWEHPEDIATAVSYRYNGGLFSFDVNARSLYHYQGFDLDVGFDTALAYADGMIGMKNRFRQNILMLRPVGNLKGSSVGISKSMSSESQMLPKAFGTVAYDMIEAYAPNNIFTYTSGSSEWSTGSTFSYSVDTTSRGIYTAKMNIPMTYTVTGTIYKMDGTPYDNYSAPVYNITPKEDGTYSVDVNDSQYLFTDETGRFIFTPIEEGLYLFDLKVGDMWYAYCFEVKDEWDRPVLVLEDYQASSADSFVERIEVENQGEGAFGEELADSFDGYAFIPVADTIDEEKFWESLYNDF